MKKLLKAALSVFLAVIIIGLMAGVLRGVKKPSEPSEDSGSTDISSDSTGGSEDSSPEEMPEGVYSISYKIAGSEEALFPAYEWLKKSGGSYPEEYTREAGTCVSELAGTVEYVGWEGWEGTYMVSYAHNPENRDEMVAFGGWYLDAGCEESFSGEIEAGTEGDITLYAKLQQDNESNWTKFY